jgi:hypothetical protein
MLPPNRAKTFENAPLDELLTVLLRQLKRPLAAQGFQLTDTEADRIASAWAARQQPAERMTLRIALLGVVKESEAVLAKMGLTFEQSLDASMNDVPGWETTAEFLDVANEKSNAELRILLSAALMLMAGDRQYAPALLHVAGGDYGDETAIARRALLFASGASPDEPNWLDHARAWLNGEA